MNADITPPGRRSRTPGPEDVQAVQDALRKWSGRQKGVAPNVTQAWTQQLGKTGIIWTVCGPQLPQRLNERFAVVVELTARWDRAPAADAPQSLRNWFAYGRQIGEYWPPESAGDWHALLVELSGKGNALVDGVIAQAMAAAWQAGRVPRSVTNSLAPLVQSAAEWSRTVPLPPPGKRSLDANDYVLLHQRAQQCAAFQRETEQIAEEVELAQANVERTIPNSGDRHIAEALESVARSVAATYRELSSLLAQGRHGLPIETSALQERADEFFEALEPLQKLSHPFAEPIKNRITSELPQIRARWEQLLAERELESVSEPEPEPVPDSGPPKGSSHPQPEKETPQESWADRIVALSFVTTLSGEDSADQFSERLNDLAAAWRAHEEKGDDESRTTALRQLVGCLISLDQQADQPRPPSWVDSVRSELRELLAEDGSYRLLDSELVGDGIDRCKSEAEAIGHTVSKTVKSGYIASVKRSGYAVKQSDGGWRVLQKAQVLLAR